MESKMIFCKTEEASRLPVYATTIGYWEHQIETQREQGFPDYQLHQVLEGKGELWIGGDTFTVSAGDVFFLFPGVPHRYEAVTQRWGLAWVSFNGREASQMLSYAGISRSGVSRLREEKLLTPLEDMLELNDNHGILLEIERSKLLYSLLLDLKASLQISLNHDQDLERLKPVLRYIDKHLHRPLPLGEIAEAAGISSQYLCRLFQKTMRVRPMSYINQERINRSKALMFSEGQRRLYEIAQMVGFENASYFCSVFKRYTGMSPEEFRKLHGLI